MKCFFVIFKIRTYLTLRPANFITTGSPVFRISYANDYMIIFVWARWERTFNLIDITRILQQVQQQQQQQEINLTATVQKDIIVHIIESSFSSYLALQSRYKGGVLLKPFNPYKCHRTITIIL